MSTPFNVTIWWLAGLTDASSVDHLGSCYIAAIRYNVEARRWGLLRDSLFVLPLLQVLL